MSDVLSSVFRVLFGVGEDSGDVESVSWRKGNIVIDVIDMGKASNFGEQ